MISWPSVVPKEEQASLCHCVILGATTLFTNCKILFNVYCLKNMLHYFEYYKYLTN